MHRVHTCTEMSEYEHAASVNVNLQPNITTSTVYGAMESQSVAVLCVSVSAAHFYSTHINTTYY